MPSRTAAYESEPEGRPLNMTANLQSKSSVDPSRRPQIAFVSTRDARSRASNAHFYMARALQKHCGDVNYLRPAPNTQRRLLGRLRQRVNRIQANRERYLTIEYATAAARELKDLLDCKPFDIVFAPMGSPLIAMLDCSIPLVYASDATFRLMVDYFPKYTGLSNNALRVGDDFERMAISRADLILYPSQWAARSAIDDYGGAPENVHVVPFGANLDDPPTAEQAVRERPAESCRLLFVGTDWRRKGGDVALEVQAMLRRMGCLSILTICGCTPPVSTLPDGVSVVGRLDKNDPKQRRCLYDLYLSHHFLLFPTRADCSPHVVNEANAFGLPALVTDTGGVAELVHSGRTGLVFESEDEPEDYAQKIVELYSDHSAYTEMVRASRLEFETRLNWDAWGRSVKRKVSRLLLSSVVSPQRVTGFEGAQ